METSSKVQSATFVIFIICSEIVKSAVIQDPPSKSLKLKRSLLDHTLQNDHGYDPTKHNDYDRSGYIPVYYKADAYSSDVHHSEPYHKVDDLHNSKELKAHAQYAPKYIHVFEANGHHEDRYPYKGLYHVTYSQDGYDHGRFISKRTGYGHSGYSHEGHTMPKPRHFTHHSEEHPYDHPIFKPLGYERFLEAHNGFRIGYDHKGHGTHGSTEHDSHHHNGYDEHLHERDYHHDGHDGHHHENDYHHDGYDRHHSEHESHHNGYDRHHSEHDSHHNGYDEHRPEHDYHHNGYDHDDEYDDHHDRHHGYGDHHNGYDDHTALGFSHYTHNHVQGKPHQDHGVIDKHHGHDSGSNEHGPKHFAFEDHLKKGFGHGIFAKYAKKYGYTHHALENGH